ncbi:MAG: DUF4856 domain-containing protein [Bacteroidia bacterium]
MLKNTLIYFVAGMLVILLFSACAETIPGCTDPSSPNYDPLATRDDGSCAFNVPDTYTFLRSESSSVEYSLSTSRQLRLASFAQLLSQLGESGASFTDPFALIYGNPDTLMLELLVQNGEAVEPDSLGNSGSSDILSALLRPVAGLPDPLVMFSEASAYIENQVLAGKLGTPEVYTSAGGVDFAHLLPAMLQGHVLLQPAFDSLLPAVDTLNNINISSNATIAEGAWDLAFGAYGLPPEGASWYDGGLPYNDVNSNDTIALATEYIFAYARAALDRDEVVSAAQFHASTYRAFREGRAALAFGPERLAEAQMARMTILSNWERIVAATAIHHLNTSIANLEGTTPDLVGYRADWSAAYGHIYSLGVLQTGSMGNNTASNLLEELGSRPDFGAAYIENLKSIREAISQQYAFPDSWYLLW